MLAIETVELTKRYGALTTVNKLNLQVEANMHACLFISWFTFKRAEVLE